VCACDSAAVARRGLESGRGRTVLAGITWYYLSYRRTHAVGRVVATQAETIATVVSPFLFVLIIPLPTVVAWEFGFW